MKRVGTGRFVLDANVSAMMLLVNDCVKLEGQKIGKYWEIKEYFGFEGRRY